MAPPPSQREETDCVKLVSKFDEDRSSGSRVTGVQSWSLTLYKAERHTPGRQLVTRPPGGRTVVPTLDTRYNIFLEKLGDDLRPTFFFFLPVLSMGLLNQDTLS